MCMCFLVAKLYLIYHMFTHVCTLAVVCTIRNTKLADSLVAATVTVATKLGLSTIVLLQSYLALCTYVRR